MRTSIGFNSDGGRRVYPYNDDPAPNNSLDDDSDEEEKTDADGAVK